MTHLRQNTPDEQNSKTPIGHQSDPRLGFKTTYLVKFANKAFGKATYGTNNFGGGPVKVRQYQPSVSHAMGALN